MLAYRSRIRIYGEDRALTSQLAVSDIATLTSGLCEGQVILIFSFPGFLE